MNKSIKFLIFLGVTLLIFYLIFRKVDYVSLKEILLNAQWQYLVLGVLIIFLVPFLSAKKWQTILKAMSCNLRFWDSFKIIMAAFPLSAITPAKTGDLIKAYYLRDKIPASQTVGAVAAERVVDVFVLAFYSLIGSIIIKNGLILAISSALILLILLLFGIINKVRFPFLRWGEKIENFLHVSRIFVNKPKTLLPVIFYSCVLWLLPILSAKVLFLALGVNIPLFYMAAAFPIAIFIGLIPITIAGMGTRDSAIIYLFSLWASPSICLGVGLLYSLFAYWFLALIGLSIMKKYYD